MIVIARQEFELAYNEAAVQYVSNYAAWTHFISLGYGHKVYKKALFINIWTSTILFIVKFARTFEDIKQEGQN